MEVSKLSLAEYFKQNGLQEVKHIELILEDGTKVGLDGRQALMWWRQAQNALKGQNRQPGLAETFRPVQADGTLQPFSIKEMIELHDWSTGYCSFAGHMRKSSMTYTQIMEEGRKAIPSILNYLKKEKAGMNIILLLQDITQTSPYEPEIIAGTGFAKYTVNDCRQAWLAWGIKNNFCEA